MNLSPEMLKRFERLYVEEQDHYWRDKPYPQELKDDRELRDQYVDWRTDTKDAPLERAADQFMIEHLAKEKKAKEAQQAQEEEPANESQQA